MATGVQALHESILLKKKSQGFEFGIEQLFKKFILIMNKNYEFASNFLLIMLRSKIH